MPSRRLETKKETKKGLRTFKLALETGH